VQSGPSLWEQSGRCQRDAWIGWKASWRRKGGPFLTRMLVLPSKLNEDLRHHIPRLQHKVTNWPAYEAGLRQRGSLTVWFSDEAVAAWAAEPRTMHGGQPWYSCWRS
jgi:hypothetical protein